MLSDMRPDVYGRIAERAQSQLGLISWRCLREIEMRADSFRAMSGWSERCPHVFAHDVTTRTWRQDVKAALLCARSGAVATSLTAARLWGVPTFERERDVMVLAKRGGSHRLCHGQLQETFWLPSHHRAVAQELDVVAIRRLPFELAPVISRPRLRWVIDFCMNERGLTKDGLALTVAELCRSGRPGSAEMRRQVDELVPGYVPPASVLAAKYRDVCLEFGLDPGVVEVNAGGERWIGRVDVIYRDAKLIVELDSRRWHNTRDGFESDRHRSNELVAAGWRVIRITWRMLHDDPAGVARLIRSALCGR